MKNEITRRKIPDFFAQNKIIDASGWEKYRAELKDLLLKEEYGYFPPRITPKVTTEAQGVDFAGKAKWESIFFTFENNGVEHTVKTELILPKKQEKSPVFLYISFAKEVPNKYLPIEEIIDNGFGVFTFCYENVTTDNGDFNNGLCSLFERNGTSSYGKITLWAYMASICMDYLCTRDEVDSKRVAVIGHSRLGKTALLASVFDERFLLTCSNNSGCCGSAISRGKNDKNESIRDITDVFPFWFCEEILKYRDNANILPFDQHMLLALIAPRHLMIGCAQLDEWADNKGQELSAYMASYAWTLYGKRGYVKNNDSFLSVSESAMSGEIGVYLRKGTHFLSRDDWQIYMKKFKEIIENET